MSRSWASEVKVLVPLDQWTVVDPAAIVAVTLEQYPTGVISLVHLSGLDKPLRVDGMTPSDILSKIQEAWVQVHG